MSTNRLLVIDDEPDIAATVGRVARRAGFDTIITTDGEDFLERVRSWNPTVIALDLAMPEMTGSQLISRLAEANCSAQILLISGYESDAIEKARAIGLDRGLKMAGYLQKPLRVEELRIALREIFDNAGMISHGDLVDALNTRQFTYDYQPKIDLGNLHAIGAEALARWNHPVRGLISPEIFIPLMEDSKVILDFTRGTIADVTAQMRAWEDQGLTPEVAINISGRCFAAFDVDEAIAEACAAQRIPPARITVEITETAAMLDETRALACMQRLKALGVHLSIDDFGTAYSSLVRLYRLPFSELKIDKSFVVDCLTDEESRLIVSAIIDLAHNLGRRVVAEGVETQAAMNHLRALGCNIGQGYFFSHPLPPARMAEWLRAWSRNRKSLAPRMAATT